MKSHLRVFLLTTTACGANDAKMPDAIDAMMMDNGSAGQHCSILPQAGCDLMSSCDLEEMTFITTACRKIGAGRETSGCQTNIECDRGYTCLGVCVKYCAA